MGKGIHISTLLYLIIAAIVLIIFAPMLIRAAGAVWEQILRSLGLVSPSTPLEQAVECAYLRCTDGCLHPRVVEEIKWVEDGKIVACNDFCGPEVLKDDGNHVCGWNAMQYPVEIASSALEDGKKYSKKIGGIDFTCVTPLDTPELRDTWNDIAKGTVAGTMVGMACVGAAMIFWPAAIVTCPIAIVGTWLWGQASYDHLLLDPVFIRSRAIEPCKLPPDIGGPVYSESVKEFTLKSITPTEINPEGKVYIFADREIGGVLNPGDRKKVMALSIPTYIIIPQKEERQVQLVRNNWNRIKVENIGDVLVKPITSLFNGEIYLKSTIKCPDGKQEEGLEFAKCKEGERFCDNTVAIKCLDIIDTQRLFFVISYGIPPPGVELYEKEEFKGSMQSFTSDTPDLKALNNKVNSVKLPRGWKATLYENKDYRGKNITIAGNSSSLGLGDAVSSIFIPRGCSATIYEHEEYKGASRTLTSSISNLQDLTGPCSGWSWACPCKLGSWWNCEDCWNDCISSIEVKEGCSVTLHAEPDYKGKYVVVSGRSSSLHFSNNAESLKITKPVVR